MVANEIVFDTGRLLYRLGNSQNCIIIDEKGIRHFKDLNGNGEFDPLTESSTSSFFLGNDGTGHLGIDH